MEQRQGSVAMIRSVNHGRRRKATLIQHKCRARTGCNCFSHANHRTPLREEPAKVELHSFALGSATPAACSSNVNKKHWGAGENPRACDCWADNTADIIAPLMMPRMVALTTITNVSQISLSLLPPLFFKTKQRRE